MIVKELKELIDNPNGKLIAIDDELKELHAITHAWLIAHNIPFHGIAMCMKPGADIYIDDKAVHPNDLFI